MKYKMKIQGLLVAGFGMLFGCVGEFEPTSNTKADTVGQALFQSQVQPLVLAQCGSSGCHGTGGTSPIFATATDSYDTFMLHRDTLVPGLEAQGSELVVKGSGSHHGAILTEADVTLIEEWLLEEKTSGEAGISVLAAFAACTTLEDFTGRGIANAWANKNANNTGQCEACHATGNAGVVTNENSEFMYQECVQDPTCLSKFLVAHQDGKARFNYALHERVGQRKDKFLEHGDYIVGEGDGATQRWLNFIDDTYANMEEGNCGDPPF